jgi:hypothetical protein
MASMDTSRSVELYRWVDDLRTKFSLDDVIEVVRNRIRTASSDDEYDLALRAPRTMTILSLARLPLRRDGHFRC